MDIAWKMENKILTFIYKLISQVGVLRCFRGEALFRQPPEMRWKCKALWGKSVLPIEERCVELGGSSALLQAREEIATRE